MLHVWTIVLAGAFPQNSMKLYNSWMRPNKPDGSGNSIPFYADNLLSLGINDVYRLVSTTVTFAFLIPYSVIKVSRNLNWSFAQWVCFLSLSLFIELMIIHFVLMMNFRRFTSLEPSSTLWTFCECIRIHIPGSSTLLSFCGGFATDFMAFSGIAGASR